MVIETIYQEQVKPDDGLKNFIFFLDVYFYMYSIIMYSYIPAYFNKNINMFYKSMKKICNKVDEACECIPEYVI